MGVQGGGGFDAFLLVYERYLDGTRLAVKTQRNRWLLARRIGKPPADWVREDVLAIMRAQPKASSARQVLTDAKAVCRDLARLGLLEHDPTSGIDKPAVGRWLPRPVQERHAELILALPAPVSDWATMAMFAGLRRAEVCGLEGDALLDLAAGPTVRVVGKGGVDWLVPAHPRVVEVFDRYATAGRLWPLSVSAFSHRWQRAMEELGIAVRFHSLRHWFGTAAYEATGADLLTTAALMRHASPSTTAIYAKVRQERAYDAIRRLA